VTAVTVVVINLASGGLLGVEAEFGVRPATLHVATREYGERKPRRQGCPDPTPVVHREPEVTLPFDDFVHSHLYLDHSRLFPYHSIGVPFVRRFPQPPQSGSTYNE
jgi:hypothetical protein